MNGPVKNLKMLIAYEGTNYAGFQLQKNVPTIQGELAKAVLQVTSENVVINGAGRTDSGVHARGQVISFNTRSLIPVQNLQKAFNSVLPVDILIKSAEEAPLDFHARFSARAKTYSYWIYNTELKPLFERNLVYHYKYPLDIILMQKAAALLYGKHDFKTFQAAGSVVQNTIRTVNVCSLIREGPVIRIEINADGFLYHMVRNIVGTLIMVGNQKMTIQQFQEIFNAGDRNLAGPTAPAQGLCLEEVFY